MGEKDKILTHLENEYTEPIRDPVWKHIYLSRPLIKIIQCSEFQKLQHIKQLGPTYLVYPGATHTRFNHSLGVLHIARIMVLQLVKRSPTISLTLEGVKAFLCAALLHDLGHYPYAHSLKELHVRSHESLTGEKIQNTEFSSIIRKNLNIDPGFVSAIIDRNLVNRKAENLTFFRNLLSGVLDPDKLDYLNRDAYFCGIPYGTQDVDYIISDIHPHPEKGLIITERGLSSVESLLFSKYVMYKTVYWHKTVRIATAMVKKAILLAMNSGVIDPGQLYDLNDHSLFSLADSHRFKPFELLKYVAARKLYKQVYIEPFDPSLKHHSLLEDLDFRISVENNLAGEISHKTGCRIHPEDVIIDIPERISFEIDVPVRQNKPGSKYLGAAKISSGTEQKHDNILFRESGSVFTPATINNFVRTLRHISLFVIRKDPVEDIIKKVDIPGILSAT